MKLTDDEKEMLKQFLEHEGGLVTDLLRDASSIYQDLRNDNCQLSSWDDKDERCAMFLATALVVYHNRVKE